MSNNKILRIIAGSFAFNSDKGSVEVLDDNIAVGFKYLLIESYNLCFISSFSTITSITKSAVFIKEMSSSKLPSFIYFA